jgi:hypothetical protein
MLKLVTTIVVLAIFQYQAVAGPLEDAAKKYEKYGVKAITPKSSLLKKLLRNEKIDENDFNYSIENSLIGSDSIILDYEDLLNFN